MPGAFNFATLDAPHMTLLFLATIAALTTALVIMFGQLERSEQVQRIRISFVRIIARSARPDASGDGRDR